MNLQHLKYAIEIEKTGSINKAAENLFMGQPNLSRALKELEDSLGVKIFIRTSRGMKTTGEGQEFLRYAKKIVSDVNWVEKMFVEKKPNTDRFSISVPRGSYISAAFTEFCKGIGSDRPAEYIYDETNNLTAINNILDKNYNMGIIRFQDVYEEQFGSMLESKNLAGRSVMEFSYKILLSIKNPLAGKSIVTMDELDNMIEIAHSDTYVPTLSSEDVTRQEINGSVCKRIFVFERGSQLELLSNLTNSYMRVSPMPQKTLDIYGLKQMECQDDKRRYKDMLIYRKDYEFNSLDLMFINNLNNVKSRLML